jgi:hypothetical protein
VSSLRETYNLVIIFNMYPPFFLNITMLWINTTQNAKSRICVPNSLKCTETLQILFSIRFQIRSVFFFFFINRDLFIELLYMAICSTVQLQKCIYRKLGNANIARTYIDTDSHTLKQLKVKIVIIICQTSNQSATMEQNYCSSKSIF